MSGSRCCRRSNARCIASGAAIGQMPGASTQVPGAAVGQMPGALGQMPGALPQVPGAVRSNSKCIATGSRCRVRATAGSVAAGLTSGQGLGALSQAVSAFSGPSARQQIPGVLWSQAAGASSQAPGSGTAATGPCQGVALQDSGTAL